MLGFFKFLCDFYSPQKDTHVVRSKPVCLFFGSGLVWYSSSAGFSLSIIAMSKIWPVSLLCLFLCFYMCGFVVCIYCIFRKVP